MNSIIHPRLQGGPCDGQRFYVSQEQLTLMAAEPPPVNMRWNVRPDDVVQLHLYEARPFRSSKRAFGDQLYLMFCHPSLPAGDALDRAKEWIGN